MKDSLPACETSIESLVGRIADEFLRRQSLGERPDIEEFVASYPQSAEVLRKVLASLQLLDDSRWPIDDEAAAKQTPTFGVLGDFRIERELGRGGMGVVYEATQISLNRHVALKVLSLAALLDPKRLARFRNEAQAAALLEHPHITPVYAVGEDRGVHYYAMRLVRGPSLADAIASARGCAHGSPECALRPHESNAPAELATTETRAADGTRWEAATREENSTIARTRIRRAVVWARQAAEAIDYAHQQGIVHRDIKPSNLLIDAHDHLWVADFGLAQIQGGADLTLTGDVIGTLRYMSPEQLQSHHGIVDHRADIYSLGATLYELLTLRPAVTGHERGDLIRQILDGEPIRPRALAPSIPIDLETIVLTALAKDPFDRYGSAAEMADDLRNYLEGKSIGARRPSPVDRLVKWCRRRRSLVVAATLFLVALSVVSSTAAVMIWQRSVETQAALATAKSKTREARFQSARLALERGLAMCEEGNVARGLLYQSYALELCPPGETDYRRTIRANIAAWHRQLHPLELMLDHPAPSDWVAFSSDGSRIATSCHDGLVRIWSASDGRLLRTIAGNATADPNLPSWPLLASLHPQLPQVAIGGGDGSLRIVDFQTGEIIASLQRGEVSTPVRRLAFSPDGMQLLEASSSNDVRLWDLRSQSVRFPPVAHRSEVTAVAFTPDGTVIVTACFTGEIRAWSAASGELLALYAKLANDAPLALAWQDGGDNLIVGGASFSAKIWERSTGSLTEQRLNHRGGVYGVDAHRAARLVATASHDRFAQLWSWPSGRAWGAPLEHPAEVNHIAFSPDAAWFATACETVVRVWSVGDPEPAAADPEGLGQYPTGRLSPDGSRVFADGADGQVRQWNRFTGELIAGLRESGTQFEVSPDGVRLISFVGIEEAICHRLEDSQIEWRMKPRHQFRPFPIFSPSGKKVMLIDFFQAMVIDTASGKLLQRILQPTVDHPPAAFSGDDQLLAICVDEDAVQIFDLESRKSVGAPFEHSEGVIDVAFSKPATTLLVSTKGGRFFQWNIASRELERRPTQLPMPFQQAQIVPGCRWVLGFAGDGSARFFDGENGFRIGPAFSHYGAARDPGYTADGRMVVVRGPENVVRLAYVPADPELDQSLASPVGEVRQKIERASGLSLNRDESFVHLKRAEWLRR